MSARVPPRPWADAPEEEEQPSRDVFTTELVEQPRPGALNGLTEMLANAITDALAGVDQKRSTEGKAPLPSQLSPALTGATRVTIGAIEGTLKGKSLDGALKDAQILALYAEARERNANAERAEAETRKIRMDAALEHLERVLALVKSLGVQVSVVQLPEGRWGIAFGDRLAAELPTM